MIGKTTLLIYPRGADYKYNQDQRDYYVYHPQSVSLSTSRECQASTLTGSIPHVAELFPEMGSRVQFIAEDGQCVFVGNLFKTDVDRWGTVSFTAYDYLRYLRGDISGRFSGWEVSSVVKHILDYYALPVGRIDTSGVKLWRKLVKAECCLDVIQSMLEYAEVQSVRTKAAMSAISAGGGEIWVFFHDPKTGLCFMRADDMYPYVMSSETLIGEQSLATDMSYSLSIDDDTFNSIKLFRPGDEYGGTNGVVVEDENTINQWGPLRYFEQVSDAACANKAQLEQKARLMLAWKNRPTRRLNVNAIGVPGLRAGMFINVSFPSYERILGKTARTQRMIISECTHTWESDVHTMDLSFQTLAQET